MSKPAHTMVLEEYCTAHRRILEFAESLTDAQLAWRAAPGSLNIAFFVWHVARWADHLQASTPGMTPALSRRLPAGRQVWEEQGLAAAWGFDAAATGYAETGMDMEEALAVRLAFPPKETLLSYARLAFEAAERAAGAVDEEQFSIQEKPQPLTEGVWTPGGTVGDAFFSHLLHDVYHFGMMQMLHGQQKAAAGGSSSAQAIP